MKGTWIQTGAVAAVLALVGVAWANQEQAVQEREEITAKRVTPETGIAHRSSQIVGMRVKNAQDENLGTVNDIVIDMEAGKVRYLALSYGGFLGLGDKLFAVPHDAFQVRRDENAEAVHLVLDISTEKLKEAPGFDQNNWPNFADAKFTSTIDEFYSPKRDVPRTVPER